MDRCVILGDVYVVQISLDYVIIDYIRIEGGSFNIALEKSCKYVLLPIRECFFFF